MSHSPPTCPHCQIALLLVCVPHDADRHRQLLRCPRCGHEHPLGTHPGEVHSEPEYALTLNWPEAPQPATVKALRQLDPSAASQPAPKLLATVRATRTWTVSSLSRAELKHAIAICQRAHIPYHIA